MADDQALQGQSSHLANGGRGRSQLLPYQPHGFTLRDELLQTWALQTPLKKCRTGDCAIQHVDKEHVEEQKGSNKRQLQRQQEEEPEKNQKKNKESHKKPSQEKERKKINMKKVVVRTKL